MARTNPSTYSWRSALAISKATKASSSMMGGADSLTGSGY